MLDTYNRNSQTIHNCLGISLHDKEENLKHDIRNSDIKDMKRYTIKSLPGRTEYIDVLKETDNEYLVRFTRINDGRVKTSEETITRHLFNICVETGYINPMSESAVA